MQQKNWLNNLSYQKKIEKKKVPFSKQIIYCLIINLVMILLAALSIFLLPPEIPLLYGLPEGNDQLTKSWAITVPNLTSLTIMFANSIFAMNTKDEYLKKIIVLAGFTATFFAIITVLKIFFLVGRI
ncbi:MAG: hypothetical protein ABIJ05_03715 [Patescibacteria group bacterium]